MKPFLFLLLLVQFQSYAQNAPEPTNAVLKSIISRTRSFNEQERKLSLASGYPLGLHGEAEAKRRHDFALQVSGEINLINKKDLDFADEINAELLLYSFEDDISEFRFRSFLNPILSEGGFHTSLDSGHF